MKEIAVILPGVNGVVRVEVSSIADLMAQVNNLLLATECMEIDKVLEALPKDSDNRQIIDALSERIAKCKDSCNEFEGCMKICLTQELIAQLLRPMVGSIRCRLDQAFLNAGMEHETPEHYGGTLLSAEFYGLKNTSLQRPLEDNEPSMVDIYTEKLVLYTGPHTDDTYLKLEMLVDALTRDKEPDQRERCKMALWGKATHKEFNKRVFGILNNKKRLTKLVMSDKYTTFLNAAYMRTPKQLAELENQSAEERVNSKCDECEEYCRYFGNCQELNDQKAILELLMK